MSQNAAFDDASIPVLTEFVEEAQTGARPASNEAAPGPEPVIERRGALAEPPAAAVPAAADAQLEARAIDSWSGAEWATLERRVAERVLQQLQGRVDFVLEQRLRDSMAEVLQHAISGLTAEIREGLQQTIQQVVVRAVAQELAHLQTLKK
jgi:hypothetical protein